MRARQLTVLSIMIGLMLLPLAAVADSHEMAPKPLTWVSYIQSQPGKSTALTQHLAENGAKIYDGLMPDGHVLSWGVAMSINHRPGDEWNVMEWVTFRDWAAVDSFMQAFMGMQMAKSPEEAQAEQEKWFSLTVSGSHFDEIVRHRLFQVSQEAGRLAYLTIGYHTSKPGQYQQLNGLLVDYATEVMGGLLEVGSINSYGVANPEVHGASGGTHAVWYGASSLAARDAVRAARAAAAEERGEEAQGALMEEWGAATDWSAHHDRIFLVTHNGGGGEGGEGGGE